MRKKIIVRGPVLTSSGYGEQARFALRALKQYEDFFDIYISPINWGRTSWTWQDDEERRWIDSIISKTAIHQSQGGQYDISLQVTIPNEWEKIAPINVGYTAGIETTKIAGPWIEKSNIMDKVIVVSNHAKYGFENTSYSVENKRTGETIEDFKCTTPVETVNYAVRKIKPQKLNLSLDYDFNFLVMAQWSPRKNVENTIKWFLEEFRNDEVGLVLKVNTANNCNMDKELTRRRIREITSQFENSKCKVYLLHGGMSEEELFGLYKHPKIKALINLAHGEGFGLPMFEAIYNELPVIAAGWSGHCDFLYAPKKDKKTKKIRNFPHFAKIEYDLAPVQKEAVWDEVLTAESMWCYPKEQSYKSKIRNVHNDYPRYQSLTKKLKKHLEENFSEEKIYKQFAESVYGKELKRNAKYIFVSDLFADQYLGGAELSLEALAAASSEENIKINSKEVNETIVKLYSNKTWVLGNYTGLEVKTISALSNNNVDYSVVEFDYKFCKYRNLELHKLMEGKDCDCEYSEHGEAVKDFLSSAKRVFFMSEKQKEIHLDRLSLDKEKCVVLSSVFTDKTLDDIKHLREKYLDKKQNFWAISGSPNWVKGSDSAKKWCHENNVDFVELNNMPYEEALEVVAKAKGVCLLPPGADTCPRFIIEAKLLGCELHYNENVQHADENWFDTDDVESIDQYLRNYKERFWNNI
tara:strand:- start:791 stop:2872 length:2082 start_codon:yes stop_codon:yes gene_type:complete